MLPFAIANDSSYWEAGYVRDVENILLKLKAAGIERAERGIIYVDGIIRLPEERTSITRDVSGGELQ